MTVFVGADGWVSADETYTLQNGQYKLLLTDAMVGGVWVGNDVNGYGNELDNMLDGNTGSNEMNGFAGNDTIFAGGGNDTVYGGQGHDNLAAGDDIDRVELDTDFIYGGAGNDTMDGGLGDDTMDGGTGNDHYYRIDAGDTLIERAGEGQDVVIAEIDYTLPDFIEELEMIGAATIGIGNSLANFIEGNALNNFQDGRAGSDELEGWEGNDTLIGGAGADTLLGGKGSDTLAGGVGADKLIGGGGQDAYLFDTRLNAASNVDAVDFVARDDTIQLDNGIFSRFLKAGVTLSAAHFKANAAGIARDANDYIVYDTDSGKLYYDADGNGAGAAVHFATLVGAPAITAADFFIV